MSIDEAKVREMIAASIAEIQKYDATLFQDLVGSRVIIRDNMSGVYVGELLSTSRAGAVVGGGARQLHYWAQGGSVAQIAEAGIGGADSRVTAPLSSDKGYRFQAPNIVSIYEMTDIAWERVHAFPAWTGGLD